MNRVLSTLPLVGLLAAGGCQEDPSFHLSWKLADLDDSQDPDDLPDLESALQCSEHGLGQLRLSTFVPETGLLVDQRTYPCYPQGFPDELADGPELEPGTYLVRLEGLRDTGEVWERKFCSEKDIPRRSGIPPRPAGRTRMTRTSPRTPSAMDPSTASVRSADPSAFRHRRAVNPARPFAPVTRATRATARWSASSPTTTRSSRTSLHPRMGPARPRTVRVRTSSGAASLRATRRRSRSKRTRRASRRCATTSWCTPPSVTTASTTTPTG